MCKIERRYATYHVNSLITKALNPSNGYLEEDSEAILMLLDGISIDHMPHTWGRAVLDARMDRYRTALRHKYTEMYARWVLDHYVVGSYCDL